MDVVVTRFLGILAGFLLSSSLVGRWLAFHEFRGATSKVDILGILLQCWVLGRHGVWLEKEGEKGKGSTFASMGKGEAGLRKQEG